MKKRIIAGVLTAGMIFTVGCSPKLETTGITIDSFIDKMSEMDSNDYVSIDGIAANADIKEGKGGISQYTSKADIDYEGTAFGSSELKAEIETKTNEIISLEYNVSLLSSIHSVMLDDAETGAAFAVSICNRLYDCAEIICGLSATESEDEVEEVIKEIINSDEGEGETTRSYNGYKVTFSLEDTVSDFTIKIEMEETEEE
ncbi:MAG: hypothetical protein ACI4JD_07440 [Ruminococcus sp.]